jgi:tetratricopeptide (TPR) repeat protein
LQRSYGNQALILQAWGRLEEAMALHKKEEALCLELGNKDGLGASYGNQALILRAWGRLEEAMALHKKEEALSLELGNKDGLGASYGNQALILQAWGRLEEALELLEKQEALYLELGNRSGLAYCYWNWGLLARKQNDRITEREKLTAALNIFTELNMPRECDAVRAELNKTKAAGRWWRWRNS